MENVKYRDFARKPNDYMGKRVDIIGRDGIIGSLFPPVLSDKECQTKEKLSDNNEKFEELKKEIVGIPKFVETEEIMPEELEIEELKLRGEHPLDLNEYIDEGNGTLAKYKCDFCGTSKIVIKMNNDGNNICLNCSPSIPAFASYKNLSEYNYKSVTTGQVMHKQTGFSDKVKAIPKPKKKSKSTK